MLQGFKQPVKGSDGCLNDERMLADRSQVRSDNAGMCRSASIVRKGLMMTVASWLWVVGYVCFCWLLIRWVTAGNVRDGLMLRVERRSPTGHHWVDDWAADVERRRAEAMNGVRNDSDFDPISDKRLEEAIEAWIADRELDE